MRVGVIEAIAAGGRALLVSVSVVAPAAAQGSDAAQNAAMRQSCAADYAAHCNGRNPAPGIERACLGQYYLNLSPACQAALDAGRGDQGGAAAGQ